jgi:uncharacterized protein with PQ loop repeat
MAILFLILAAITCGFPTKTASLLGIGMFLMAFIAVLAWFIYAAKRG